MNNDLYEADELCRRFEAVIAFGRDMTLAELADVADPGPGFDSRKASQQRRYEKLEAQLDVFLAVHDRVVVRRLTIAQAHLTRSAAHADQAARAFDLELEELLR